MWNWTKRLSRDTESRNKSAQGIEQGAAVAIWACAAADSRRPFQAAVAATAHAVPRQCCENFSAAAPLPGSGDGQGEPGALDIYEERRAIR